MTRSRTRQSRTRTKGGLTQSSSTSRLFASRKPFLEPLEELPKRHASTEGRFSIIDECNKDTDSDSDIESPLPTDDRFKNCRDVKPNFSKSVDFFNSKTPMPVSRFKIVPVESKYKRGRWDCFDYYEKESMCAKNPKISCPGPNPLFPPTPKKDRGARSLSEIVPVPLTAPPTQTISFNFEEPYDGSDRENTEPFNRSQGAVPKDSSKIVRPPPSEPKKIPNGVPIQSPEQMTPTELLQTGLEITLNTSDKKMETDENQDLKEDSSTSSNNNGTSPAMVAIDSKIEQAMDLVKTHLMFAVREEVEVLRAKIVDLESHIHHLEAENSVLKDHIPEDIMKNLNLGMSK